MTNDGETGGLRNRGTKRDETNNNVDNVTTPPTTPTRRVKTPRDVSPRVARAERRRKQLESFRYQPDTLRDVMAVWAKRGWPSQLLLRDHFSAKVLTDNKVLELAEFHNHEWKFDDKQGLLIQKQGSQEPVEWRKLLPDIELIESAGEYLFDGVVYSHDGLTKVVHWRYPPKEFKTVLSTWVKRGLPVQLLFRDHFSAKVLHDNGVFMLAKAFGHKWKWDNKLGLLIPKCQEDENGNVLRDKPYKLVPWNDIKPHATYVDGGGIFYFNSLSYRDYGFSHEHLWKWKTISPTMRLPKEKTLPYCWIDILCCSWEKEGFQSMLSPGHTYLEFADDLGNFYSIGRYYDPSVRLNVRRAIVADIHAVLMTPDPYMSLPGQKSVHRYSFGPGPEGRAKLLHLIRLLEEIQDQQVDPLTGEISTAPTLAHNSCLNNCADWVYEMEDFIVNELGGQLVKFEEDSFIFPRRTLLPDGSAKSRTEGLLKWIWQSVWLIIFDIILYALITIPFTGRIVAGVDQDAPEEHRSRRYFKTSDYRLGQRTSSQQRLRSSDGGDEVAQTSRAQAGIGRTFASISKWLRFGKRDDRDFPHLPQPGIERSDSTTHLEQIEIANQPQFLESLGYRPTSYPRRMRRDQLYSERLRGYAVQLVTHD